MANYGVNYTYEEIGTQLKEAERSFDEVVENLTELRRMLENVKETQATARRMDAYIIPSIENWINDKGQPGSLPDIREDIEEALATEYEAGQEEIDEHHIHEQEVMSSGVRYDDCGICYSKPFGDLLRQRDAESA